MSAAQIIFKIICAFCIFYLQAAHAASDD